jgi:hypothetical protein
MDVVCLKWGDKFNYEHVNRLYNMVRKNLDCDFNFICYTENSNDIDSNIIIRSLPDYDLETWWWKLTLFEHTTKNITLFLDLDVVIQNNITYLKNYCVENMLCLIKAYWKPYQLEQFDTNLNSSVMIWKGDCTDIWNKFKKDQDYYMLKYHGIDGYLDHNQHEKLLYFPEKIVYSRLYGVDKNNYWKASDNISPNYFYEPDYDICIFNGWLRKKRKDHFLLDDEGYKGYEQYY